MIPLIRYIDKIKFYFSDLTSELIPNGELVDIVNATLSELAEETRIYIKRQKYVHSQNEPTYYITLNIDNYSPYRIFKVLKEGGNGTFLNEYSNIAIFNQLNREYPFVINTTELINKGYATLHNIDINNQNINDKDKLYLVFDQPIKTNEIVYIDYITNQPFGDPILQVDTFDKLTKGYDYKIPTFMDQVFEDLFKLKIAKTLMFKKPEMANLLQILEQSYQKSLTRAVSYARNLKSLDAITVQPLNFLAE